MVCLLIVATDASRLIKEPEKIKGILGVTFKNGSQPREAAAAAGGASHDTGRAPCPWESSGPDLLSPWAWLPWGLPLWRISWSCCSSRVMLHSTELSSVETRVLTLSNLTPRYKMGFSTVLWDLPQSTCNFQDRLFPKPWPISPLVKRGNWMGKTNINPFLASDLVQKGDGGSGESRMRKSVPMIIHLHQPQCCYVMGQDKEQFVKCDQNLTS